MSTAILLMTSIIALTLLSCNSPESVDPSSDDRSAQNSPGQRAQPTGQPPASDNPDQPDPDGQIQGSVSDSITDVKADLGQLYLESIMSAQQVEKLVKGSFASDFAQLGLGPLPDTEEYQFSLIPTDPQMSAVTATARQENLYSYIGAVFSIGAEIPVIGICKGNQPSKIPPQLPTLSGSKVVCSPNSSLVTPITSAGATNDL